MNFNTSDFFAAIGCVTGSASFIITIFQLWKTKAKMKFIFPEDNCYFKKLDSMETSIGTHQGLVRMIVLNKSSSPITIYKIEINTKGIDVPWIAPRTNKIEIIEDENIGKSTMYSTKFNTSSKYNTPIRIEPYDIFDGFIFLPHLDNPTDTIPLSIRVSTPTKIFKVESSLPFYSQRNISKFKNKINRPACGTNNKTNNVHKQQDII